MWKATLKSIDELVEQAKEESIFQTSRRDSGKNRHSNSFTQDMRRLGYKYAPEEMAEWKEQLRQKEERDIDLFGEDYDDEDLEFDID